MKQLFVFLLTFSALRLNQGCKKQKEMESIKSGANDVIVVKQRDGSLQSTPLNAQVGKTSSWQSFFHSREGRVVKILINGRTINTEEPFLIKDSGKVGRRHNEDKLSNNELQNAHLKMGVNEGEFFVESLAISIPFNLFVYDQNARFVLTDIDGTITQSDMKGHVYDALGLSAHHDFVVEMFDTIADNGYGVIYLTARSMALDASTRNYLFQTLQDQEGMFGNRFSMPLGPVFMSPKTFAHAIIDGATNPGATKAMTINDITKLFDVKENVIKAAFGNKNSDSEAYTSAGVSTNLIYLINSKSEVIRMNDGHKTTYFDIASQASEFFPVL